MRQFVIGGAVRDILLGQKPNDLDFVWVGATPEDMLNMGMSQVGAEFPVFLDASGNEHALARKERKVGSGYHGFICDFDTSVTLKDDQYRRDITINQLAVAIEDWDNFTKTRDASFVHDGFNGIRDLAGGVIRHVSEFFKEDPVRLLRVCRQATRFDFDIAPETHILMRQMVKNGEVDSLTPERVWLELEKAMKEKNNPGKFFTLMDTVGAIEHVMPLLYSYVDDVSCAINKTTDIDERFAVMTLGLREETIEQFFDSIKAPANIKRIAVKTEKLRRWCARLSCINQISADEYVKLFVKLDVVRRPGDFALCVRALSKIQPLRDPVTLIRSMQAYVSVKFDDLAMNGWDIKLISGPDIGKAIETVRLKEVNIIVEESLSFIRD